MCWICKIFKHKGLPALGLVLSYLQTIPPAAYLSDMNSGLGVLKQSVLQIGQFSFCKSIG